MSDTKACRICLEETGKLIQPCSCKGSTGNVHEACLKKWVAESGSEKCEICKTEYARRDVVGCNITNYCDGMFRSRFSSNLEENLIRVSALHMIFGVLMYSWTPLDQWMFMSSLQSMTQCISLILFQLCHYDVDFFVLKVLVYWSFTYLICSCIVGCIRTLDNEEQCAMNCYRLLRIDGCTKECMVYSYYKKQDELVSNVMLMHLTQAAFLIGIRCVVLCFTHMKRSEYYSLSRNSEGTSTGSEEEESLLSSDPV